MKIHLQSFIGLHITDTERWVDVTDHFTGPKSEKSVIFILVLILDLSQVNQSVFIERIAYYVSILIEKNTNIMLNLMN